jgi:hypothetical protein
VCRERDRRAHLPQRPERSRGERDVARHRLQEALVAVEQRRQRGLVCGGEEGRRIEAAQHLTQVGHRSGPARPRREQRSKRLDVADGRRRQRAEVGDLEERRLLRDELERAGVEDRAILEQHRKRTQIFDQLFEPGRRRVAPQLTIERILAGIDPEHRQQRRQRRGFDAHGGRQQGREQPRAVEAFEDVEQRGGERPVHARRDDERRGGIESRREPIASPRVSGLEPVRVRREDLVCLRLGDLGARFLADGEQRQHRRGDTNRGVAPRCRRDRDGQMRARVARPTGGIRSVRPGLRRLAVPVRDDGVEVRVGGERDRLRLPGFARDDGGVGHDFAARRVRHGPPRSWRSARSAGPARRPCRRRAATRTRPPCATTADRDVTGGRHGGRGQRQRESARPPHLDELGERPVRGLEPRVQRQDRFEVRERFHVVLSELVGRGRKGEELRHGDVEQPGEPRMAEEQAQIAFAQRELLVGIRGRRRVDPERRVQSEDQLQQFVVTRAEAREQPVEVGIRRGRRRGRERGMKEGVRLGIRAVGVDEALLIEDAIEERHREPGERRTPTHTPAAHRLRPRAPRAPSAGPPGAGRWTRARSFPRRSARASSADGGRPPPHARRPRRCRRRARGGDVRQREIQFANPASRSPATGARSGACDSSATRVNPYAFSTSFWTLSALRFSPVI